MSVHNRNVKGEQLLEAAVMDTKFAFFEGKIVPIEEAKVSVMTHAIHYGTAVFAGMRAYWNADEEQLFIFRSADHFARLKQSARLLLMDIPYTAQEFTHILVDLLRHENFRQDTYIRPLVYKSYLGVGVKINDLPNEFTIFAVPMQDYLSHSDATQACFSTWRRVDDTMIPPRGKIAGAYVNSALAKSEALMNGFDEAIVLNQDGHVSEGSAANFGIVRQGVVITPPRTANVLEGITLRTVATLLHEQMGVEMIEHEIDRSEVYNADEAFFCGTGVQIAAVTSVDHRPIGTGKMGPVVGELRRLYDATVRGKLPQYRDWVQPVYTEESMKA